jgi:hypothetical protein
LEKNTVQKIVKAENGRIRKDKESMTEKRNQRELLWVQTEGALNFITVAPHCGACPHQKRILRHICFKIYNSYVSSEKAPSIDDIVVSLHAKVTFT